MHRIFAHLLLSAILIFQGIAVACVDGPMMTDMAAQSAVTSHGKTMTTASMEDRCHGCPACPEESKSGNDCLKHCSLPVELPRLTAILRQVPPSDALVSVPTVSLVDFAQVPPTPPPIA